jgi:hypothetical protein
MIRTIGMEVWTEDTILDLTQILSGSDRGSILNKGFMHSMRRNEW